MSDPSRAVRWQATAVVVAALISTTGAISSALIQTGWIGKASSVRPPAEPAPPQFSATLSQASFTGAIEPLNSVATAAAEPLPVISRPKPTAVAATYISQPLLSPQPVKASAKGIDWGAIPRFFSGTK